MEEFRDLSKYTYWAGPKVEGKAINIGWINVLKLFPTKRPPSQFLDKLWSFCLVPAVLWRHILYCDECSEG